MKTFIFTFPPNVSKIQPILKVNREVSSKDFLLTIETADKVEMTSEYYTYSDSLKKYFKYIPAVREFPSLQNFPFITFDVPVESISFSVVPWGIKDKSSEVSKEMVVLASNGSESFLVFPDTE